ncbi:unnamed protein product [Auanema sp. JU1783]|nr:unnamed protein product [Auanema sp. JU1783]
MYDLVLNEKHLAGEIVDELREKTNASLVSCIEAAKAVMVSLSKFVKTDEFSKIHDAIDSYEVDIENSYDGKSLTYIVQELTSLITQKAEYNYAYTDNDPVIKQLLQIFRDFVSKTESKIPVHVIKRDDYSLLACLVEFYQMEQSTELRFETLKSIQSLLKFCEDLTDFFLDSNLSMTIVQKISYRQQPFEEMQLLALDVLTKMYSIGKSPPLGHFDYINVEFFEKLLTLLHFHPIELMDFFVAFNSIIPTEVNNPILEAMSRDVSPIFGEFYIKSLNKQPTWNRLKLLVALCQDTILSIHNIFYDNDMEVLCNILARELKDSNDEKIRLVCYEAVKELCKRGVRNLVLEDAIRDSVLDSKSKEEFQSLIN